MSSMSPAAETAAWRELRHPKSDASYSTPRTPPRSIPASFPGAASVGSARSKPSSTAALEALAVVLGTHHGHPMQLLGGERLREQ
jgi:hypothetical protein